MSIDYRQKYNSVISSVTSAIVTKTGTHPLERLKVLQQVSNHYNTKQYNNSMLNSFKHIYKNEAIIEGLFKGNLVNLFRIIPAYILKFEFNNYYNGIFVKPYKDPSYLNFLASGICVGGSQILLTFPLETIRSLRTLDNNMLKNNSIAMCCKNIYNKKGWKSFYTGLPVSLLFGSFYIGIQFSVYNYLKKYYTKNTFYAGVTSGFLSQTICFAGDTIKRNMHANIVEKKYKNVFDCMRQLGIRKLYAGYRANLLKCVIEAPLQFYVYENMMNICKNKIDYTCII
jgi:hypothetical protein